MNPALCLALLCLPGGPTSLGDCHLDLAKVAAAISHGKDGDRSHAWKSLARAGEKGFPTAFAAMGRKRDQERATWIFQRAGAKAVPFLGRQLASRKTLPTAWALQIVAASPMLSQTFLEKTRTLIHHGNEQVREQALRCLLHVDDPRVVTWLLAFVKRGRSHISQNPIVRDLLARHATPESLCTELRRISSKYAKGLYPLAMALNRLDKGQPLGTYEVLVSALASMGRSALPCLEGLLLDPQEGNRRAGAIAIGLAGPEAGPLLEKMDESTPRPTAWTWLAHLYAIEKQGRAPAWLIPDLRRDMDSGDAGLADCSLRAYSSLCHGVHLAIRSAGAHPSDNLIACVAALGRHAELAMVQLALVPKPGAKIHKALKAAAALEVDPLDEPEAKPWHQLFLENQVMR